MRNSPLIGRVRPLAACAAIALGATTAPPAGASSYTFKAIYDFCSQSGCTDGERPTGNLVMDSGGNLYGSTAFGGGYVEPPGQGTIFELVNHGGIYEHRVLYRFCQLANCKDGSVPYRDLILDSSGNLYGITLYGGTSGRDTGTVFMLKPNRKRTKWTLKTLHSFCSDFGGSPERCRDGRLPSPLTYRGAEFGLPYDGQSPLFGVTAWGGTFGLDEVGAGIAFQLSGTKHKFKVIYNFCANGLDCNYDSHPADNVVSDSSGNLFGTTNSFGATREVYELSPSGSTYIDTVLYKYHYCTGDNCTDGRGETRLTINSDGSLVGTNSLGGSCDYGNVFKLVPNGVHSQYIPLWNFCTPVEEGSNPIGKILVGANGNFFGTTAEGGSYGLGVLFELTPNGGILY